MKLSFVAVLALASAAVAPALADDKIVKIGVLTDLSSLYADDRRPRLDPRHRRWRSRTAD